MTTGEQGMLIAMADGNIKDHERVKNAARECNVNHVFTSVYNGIQLLDLLNKRGAYSGGTQSKPDLLLMDIHLELLDGFEALKQIKADPVLRNIPVYILTSERKDEDVQKAIALGAKDYFKKPLKTEDLNEIIRNICKLNL